MWPRQLELAQQLEAARAPYSVACHTHCSDCIACATNKNDHHHCSCFMHPYVLHRPRFSGCW